MNLLPSALAALRASAAVLPGLLASIAGADVLVVAPSGAPFTQPQAAIDAAADGDTVLIKPGGYSGFALNGKSISVIADVEGSVNLQSMVLVRNISAGKRAVLAGLRYRPGGLLCLSSSGSIRLEALQTDPPPHVFYPGHALEVRTCNDVALLRCKLVGGFAYTAFPSNAGEGLVCEASNVAIYDSEIRGGKGSDGGFIGTNTYPALGGGAGARFRGFSGPCTALLSNTLVAGGEGGTGTPGYCFGGPVGGGNGGPGGTGLVVETNATVHVLDCVLAGGPGGVAGAGNACGAPPGNAGLDGAPSTGPYQSHSGPSASLTCATHVREQQALTLQVKGQPGDDVVVLASDETQWLLLLPLKGVQLVGPFTRRLDLGTIPAGGLLQQDLFFGDLGPGVESVTWHLQAVLRDTAGALRLGSAAAVVVLDSAF